MDTISSKYYRPFTIGQLRTKFSNFKGPKIHKNKIYTLIFDPDEVLPVNYISN
jgi:hypothetical protein